MCYAKNDERLSWQRDDRLGVLNLMIREPHKHTPFSPLRAIPLGAPIALLFPKRRPARCRFTIFGNAAPITLAAGGFRCFS